MAMRELPNSLYYHWIKTLPKVSEHCMFQGCHKVHSGRPFKEGDDGPGVDTDFILYVSAQSPSHCSTGTIAYATYCQLEQALDRYEHTALSYTYINKQTKKRKRT